MSQHEVDINEKFNDLCVTAYKKQFAGQLKMIRMDIDSLYNAWLESIREKPSRWIRFKMWATKPVNITGLQETLCEDMTK